MKKILFITTVVAFMAMQANADIISVAGPASSAGALPSIIAAPASATNAAVTNFGQEGFDEIQNYVTLAAIGMDAGILPLGSFVDSHMIFLNAPTSIGGITHTSVRWTFGNPIIGVMSDQPGTLEAASTVELGAPLTTYQAPFNARGMELNDSYLIAGSTLTVNMLVSQPGDWIRVVTHATPVPGAFLLGSLGLGFASWRLRRRRTA